MTVRDMMTKFKVAEKDMAECPHCCKMKLFKGEHGALNGTDHESGERICNDCHYEMSGQT